MKNYCKGLLSGIIVTAIIFSIPALAQNIQAVFNEIRININGIDRVQRSEEITLDNGSTVPYSIVYGDTTYLPMRKISEFCNKPVYWNGDTNTVSMTDIQTQNAQRIITEKPDKNGNIWTYYTFKTNDGKSYLGVKDIQRNYERIYQIVGDATANTSVSVTEEAVYFVKNTNQYESDLMPPYLYKIAFSNDENTQDGEKIKTLLPGTSLSTNTIIFEGDYLYYTGRTSSTSFHGVLDAINYITGETAHFSTFSWGQDIYILGIRNGDEGGTTLKCDLRTPGSSHLYDIPFYKDGELRFGEPSKIEILR